MIVRCIRITDKQTGEDKGAESPWLRVGASYPVLGVLSSWETQPARIVLPSDNPPWWLPDGFDKRGDPIMVFPSDFAIVSSKVSRYWAVNITSRGSLDMMPEPWLSDGFWEGLEEEGTDDCVGLYCEFWKRIEAEGY